MLAARFSDVIQEAAKERQRQHAGTAPGKKSLSMDSSEVIDTRKAIADLAEVSEYKAGQALAVRKQAPELVSQVESGAMSVLDATKAVQEKNAQKPQRRSAPKTSAGKQEAYLKDTLALVNKLWSRLDKILQQRDSLPGDVRFSSSLDKKLLRACADLENKIHELGEAFERTPQMAEPASPLAEPTPHPADRAVLDQILSEKEPVSAPENYDSCDPATTTWLDHREREDAGFVR
jgi:hypothetical protein